MESPGANPYRFIMRYSADEGGPVSLVERTFTQLETYQAMSQVLTNMLFSLSFGTQPPFEILQAQLCHIDNTSATSDAPILACVQLAGSSLEFSCYSNLSIQNRTISSTAAGDASNDNRNDVANNPVSGKQYMGYGNGTNLRLQDRATPGAVSLIADASSGLISLDLANPDITPAQFRNLRRPPRGDSFTNVSSQRQAFLNPGYIKTGRLEYKKSMRVSSFILNLRDTLQEGAINTTRIGMGSFQFFGFEKKCNTRVDEPVISVGYEINQTYQCIVREAKTAVSTHVEIL
ncbi:hypothetical protein N9924_01405 [bacterium]|nr:hypothetical protein [bacterium]